MLKDCESQEQQLLLSLIVLNRYVWENSPAFVSALNNNNFPRLWIEMTDNLECARIAQCDKARLWLSWCHVAPLDKVNPHIIGLNRIDQLVPAAPYAARAGV
jgi:hypothetical protein